MINYSIYTSVDSLPKEWDNCTSHDVFLQRNYLKALEEAAPENISLYFIAFYKDSILSGVAVVQRVQLYLNDIFRNYNDSCLKERFKNVISKILKGNILVVGNLTHTGQHGIYLNSNNEFNEDYLKMLFEALNELKDTIKNRHNKRIRAFLLKDYFLDNHLHEYSEFLNNSGFYKLSVQPNMIMEIKTHWNIFDDYIADLQKKYRDRYKAARKKAKQIIKTELSLDDIQAESKNLYKLYKNVSDNAKINTFVLPEYHFLEFKKELKNAFMVFGYYLDNELIGFYTLIINNKQLETYFLGYNITYQHKHQLYLNMLYDMAEFGVNSGFLNIIYARTAMEIKSSVGAKPKDMVMYLKHTNWLLNAFLKRIFKLMNPSQDWQERHPFK